MRSRRPARRLVGLSARRLVGSSARRLVGLSARRRSEDLLSDRRTADWRSRRPADRPTADLPTRRPADPLTCQPADLAQVTVCPSRGSIAAADAVCVRDRHRVPWRGRNLGPRPGGGRRHDHGPAAERAQLRQPGRSRAGRGAAAGILSAEDQRRPAPDQRIPLRRRLGPAAGTRPGGLLSQRRCDPGIQDREQQPGRRIRPLQRRRRQSHDQVGQQCTARHPLRVLPACAPR